MNELDRARAGDSSAFATLITPYQRELRAHCYRMAGAIDEADDLLQDALLRAWRGLPSYEGTASLRTWLYRVTTSACIDRLRHQKVRRRAEDGGAASTLSAPMPPPGDERFLGPCPADLYADDAPSPEAHTTTRESVSFAFLAALQLLPPQQRATLIACDVLGFTAVECAALVDSSVVSVESALRRARATIADKTAGFTPKSASAPESRALVARYVDAWERGDSAALVTLLHESASMSMPPMPIWFSGPHDIGASLEQMVFAGCGADVFRGIATEANGLPAVGIYRRSDAGFVPFALHTLAFDPDGQLRTLTAFLDPTLFPTFGLPASA